MTSSAKGTTASAGGTRFVKVTQDVRPQVTGIYSALDERLDPVSGVSVQITPDTRFQSVPHPIKLLAIELAVLTVLIGLILVGAFSAYAAVGSAGIARIAGDRMGQIGTQLTPFAATTRGVALYVLAGYTPIVGWFCAAPAALVLSVGAGIAART